MASFTPQSNFFHLNPKLKKCVSIEKNLLSPIFRIQFQFSSVGVVFLSPPGSRWIYNPSLDTWICKENTNKWNEFQSLKILQYLFIQILRRLALAGRTGPTSVFQIRELNLYDFRYSSEKSGLLATTKNSKNNKIPTENSLTSFWNWCIIKFVYWEFLLTPVHIKKLF